MAMLKIPKKSTMILYNVQDRYVLLFFVFYSKLILCEVTLTLFVLGYPLEVFLITRKIIKLLL